MPDPVTHYVFGMDLLNAMPDHIRRRIDPGIYGRALQGPDPWSTIGFYGGAYKKFSDRSSILHKQDTGAFLRALAAEGKMDDAMFSVFAGTVAHYCLDKLAHPYIICKGGAFDGTEETRSMSGGHVRLERAIDSYYIRTRFRKIPWFFSVPRWIMKLRQYPESLRVPLNRVYRQVYGWEDVFDPLNRSLRDERLFYGLMQDPFGIIHYLLRPLSKGRTNYCIYSYFRRDGDDKKLDCLNRSKYRWRHPFDPNLVSTASFEELYRQARGEALSMIAGELEFGNANYSTGFDCEDPRNLVKPTYDPIEYPHKYWNTI